MIPLMTEKVTLTSRILEPNTYATSTFWIAYPMRIAGYGDTEYRTAMALGTGTTCTEALADANSR